MIKNPFQEEYKFDTRIRAHQFRRGVLDEKAVEAHLAELPDEAAEAVESNVRFTTPFADRLKSDSGRG